MNRNLLMILACAWSLACVLIGSGSAAVPPQARVTEPRTFRTALLEVACLSISADQRFIAIGGLTHEMLGRVEILDWGTGEQHHLIRTETEPSAAARTEFGNETSYGGVDRVRWIGFSADARMLAVVTYEGLTFWDVSTGQRLEVAMGGTDRSTTGFSVHRAAAFSSDNRWFIGGQPPTLWDIAQTEPKWTLPTSANGFAFSPDSRLLATAEYLNRIHLWRVSDGVQVAEVRGQMGPLDSVAFARDGSLLAASGEGGAHIWDVVVKDGQYAFHEHPPLCGMIPFGAVHSMSFSHDG